MKKFSRAAAEVGGGQGHGLKWVGFEMSRSSVAAAALVVKQTLGSSVQAFQDRVILG